MISKKARKKVARKNKTNGAFASDKSTDNQPALKSTARAPSVAGKSYLTTDELEKHYRHVKEDLKNIALIAVPLLVGLTVVSFFIKI